MSYSTKLDTYWLTRVYDVNGSSFTFFHAVSALNWADAFSLTRMGDAQNIQWLEDRTTWVENHGDHLRNCRLWKQIERPPCKTQARFSVKDDRTIKTLPKQLNFGL